MSHINEKQTITSLATLANAVELGTGIIQSILGQDLSSNLHGSSLKLDGIQQMLVERIRLTLHKKGI